MKYDKAVAKLAKDREALLSFYDFPAEHWKHIRTTNPIESTFATVRHRTGKTKGCLSRKTGLAMAFKLMMSAQGKWRKLDASNRMHEIIQGIAFVDGIKQLQPAASSRRHQLSGIALLGLLQDRHYLRVAVFRSLHQNLLFHHSRKFYFSTPLNFEGITTGQLTVLKNGTICIL